MDSRYKRNNQFSSINQQQQQTCVKKNCGYATRCTGQIQDRIRIPVAYYADQTV